LRTYQSCLAAQSLKHADNEALWVASVNFWTL
jgi:hypothetical protein